jgi:hypothetical protein
MKRAFCLALSLFIFSSLTALAGAPAFYVAPNGNDTWSGTRGTSNFRKTDGPFATVQHALQAARAPGGPATIYLRSGFYSLSEPIVLLPQDSGLTIAAYKDEKPILSGGRRISGWKSVEADGRTLWAADLPEVRSNHWYFRELWVNGRRAVRARYPNEGYLKVAELPDKTADWFQGNQRFRFAEGDLKPWKGIGQAEVMVMNRWVESRLPVESLDQTERLITFKKRSVFQLAAGDPYYLEGALEALDQPGEWCLDQAVGTLYYLPRPGESLKTLDAVAPVLSQLIRCEGAPEKSQFLERVTFRGLTFSHSEWCFPSGFESAKQKVEIDPSPKAEVGGFGQAAVGVPGAVWGNGLHGCIFEKCRFVDLGTYGLELARGCSSNQILRCEFSDLGAGGIKLGETAIRANAAEQTGGNEVTDCSIHDGGKMFHSAIGIWIGQSPNNRLTHNLIHDFYYTGISIGWTWGYGPALATNNFVAYNHVHHLGKKSDGDGPILSDMGGIYTLGMQPGTRIFNNLWHDIAGLQYGGWGIYFDEGSSSIVARSNIVYGTTHGGFHQHYGATNFVENNVFAFARDHQLQRTRPEPHVSFTFATNIVYFDHGVLLGGNWSGDRYDMDWNIFWDARPDAKANGMQCADANLEQWRARGHDVHSLITDPLFVAPKGDDFALRKDSPALKIGFQPIDLKQVGVRPEK